MLAFLCLEFRIHNTILDIYQLMDMLKSGILWARHILLEIELNNMIKTQVTPLVLLPLFTSLLLMAGCTETVNIQLEPQVDAYLVTNSKKAINLVETDAAHAELNVWLRENNTGWHVTSGRYPGGIYIKSGTDGIQVSGMEVIIYSTAGAEPDAKYVRNVGKTELPLVREIGQ